MLAKIVAIVALVAGLVVLAFPFSSRSSWFKTDTAASGKEELFRKMGVLPIPLTTEAVDFTLRDLNGNPVPFSDFRGKIVFLNFFSTWCPECRIEIPAMRKLYDGLKSRDFAMVAVDLKESAETVQKFAEKYKMTFPVLLDPSGRMAERMGIRAIPTTFIIGKEGRILGTVIGGRKWDGKESFALFEYLIDMKADASS